MPYRESIFRTGDYFHIYTRGNEKKVIFLDHADYEHFLLRMKEYKKMHKVSIICYCLMPNHFHLLLRQNARKSLSYFIHRLSVSHAMFFNKKYDRVGHLFQGRFKIKFIPNDEYLSHLSRYIHLNPLKIIKSIEDLEIYPWSSYSEYVYQNKNDEICDKKVILSQFSTKESYKDFVCSLISDKELSRVENFIIELD